MDRARRAEPYSSATIWTREVARNLAGHLARISNAHSCVDTSSPKSTQLPKFQHPRNSKRCVTSPVKTRKVLVDPLTTTTEAVDSIQSCNSSAGRCEEECGDNQNEQKDSEPAEQREEAHAQRHQHKGRHHLGQAKLAIPHKHIADINLLPESDQHEAMQETRKTLDKVRVSGQARLKVDGALGDSTYDCPPTVSNGKLRPGMDYKQKQAQLKIWQENQALAKRLRSTKPTLKSKDWERDDKWNQEFLKSQERRRSLLQTELVKAQAVPHTTIVRVRPLKLPHHEPSSVTLNEYPDGASTIGRCNTSAADGSEIGSLSARETRRRRSRSRTLGADPLSDVETQHLRSSAANHRRIMQLRQQKCLQSKENENDYSEPAKESLGGSTVDLNDNELVDVRFAFSRRRSRRASRGQGDGRNDDNKNEGAEIPQVVSTDAEQGEGKISDLAEALSPGIELEEALDRLDSEESPPTRETTEAEGSSQLSESICQGTCIPALAGSPDDQTEAAKIDVDPHIPSEDTPSPERRGSDSNHHGATDASATSCAKMPEEVSTGSESDDVRPADDDGKTEAPLPQFDAFGTATTNAVDNLPSSSSDISGPPCEENVVSIEHETDDKSGADGDQNQNIAASDRSADDNTDEQHVTSDKPEAAAASALGSEVDFSPKPLVPTTDENAVSAPPELHQAEDITAADESPADTDPDYQDDASDGDCQQEDDHQVEQVPDNGEEEGPLAARSATADGSAATDDQATAQDDPESDGDSNDYGSEYEDDAELDQDGEQVHNEQTDTAYLEKAAREEEGAHKQEEEGEGELEYSQDGFADD